MAGVVLTYLGSATVFCWGVAHLIPTRNVVAGFGEISLDNRRILAMEWITEGVALIFTGTVVTLVTWVDPASSVSLTVYWASAGFLVSMAVVSLFTGFKVAFLAFKLCPFIFTGSAILIAATPLSAILGRPAQEGMDLANEAAPAEMVLIPGGEFLMGSSTDENHSPAHTVRVEAFYLDPHEVTNAEYYEFCQATGHRLPEFWGIEARRSGPRFPEYPVVGISWQDAADYAAWRGKRLPTEAEWEYAARGGLVGKDYPHGDTLSPSDGNYAESGLGAPVEVGTYPPNGFGLFDMSGNAFEWVADRYGALYYAESPAMDPQGPETGRLRVIRGGGWHSGPYCNRTYYRNALPPQWVDFAVGFRCARDVEG